MRRILITGMSGTGKSTVIRELRRLGWSAVDLDDGWCIAQADGRQLWDERALRRLLDEDESPILFIAGCEENMSEFLPEFASVIVLTAPTEVILARIEARTDHDFGKSPEDRARVLTDIALVEPRLLQLADAEVATNRPIAQVVDAVLGVAAVAEDPREPRCETTGGE